MMGMSMDTSSSPIDSITSQDDTETTRESSSNNAQDINKNGH
jgi:hypothetical protein